MVQFHRCHFQQRVRRKAGVPYKRERRAAFTPLQGCLPNTGQKSTGFADVEAG
jgi:hypothetical protein